MTGAAHRGTSQQLLTEIDHVGIAVRDLDAAIAYYRDTFGATVSHRECIDLDGVEEALIAVADSYIQLLSPTRPDSPVARFLERRGEGLHHIGYRVDDCATARLAGHHGRLRAPQGRLRHAHRAGPRARLTFRR
jgi:methylmalonyl-CoA epimerase